MSLPRLPAGWIVAELGSLASLVTKGGTPTSYGHEYVDRGIAFVRAEHLINGRIATGSIREFIDLSGDETLRRSRLRTGDVLLSIAGTIGRTAVVSATDLPANTNQAVAIIRGTAPTVSPSYLRYLLSSPLVQDAARHKARGGTLQNISLADVRSLRIPVPPQDEQQRIVAEIEKQFTRLDAGVEGLDDALGRLRAYRAAVLRSASEGKLVAPDDFICRVTNAAPEHVTAGLRRTPSRKRAGRLWGGGVVPTLTAIELARLPDGWRWVKVKDVGYAPDDAVQVGPMSMRSSDFTAEGTPVFNVGTVRWDGFNEDKADHLPPAMARDFARYAIQPGDVLFTRSGTVGRCAVAQAHHVGWLMTFHLLRVRPNPEVCLPGFLRAVLEGAPHIRRQTREASIGTTRAGFNTSLLANLDIPLPPVSEQKAILGQIEARLNSANETSREIAAQRLRASRLRKALLKAAFQGQLPSNRLAVGA